jgi:hypothetical protein
MQRESSGFRQLAITMLASPRGCVSWLMDRNRDLLRIALAAVLACGSSFAQQTQPTPVPEIQSSQTGKPERKPSQPQQEKSGGREDQTEPRFFKMIPLANVATPEEKPLSPKEKFGLFFRDARTPFMLGSPLLATGFSEALLDNSGFGWGPVGFGKHFGAATANEVSNHLLGTWAFPSLLHQDPRYYPKTSGGIGGRIAYSVSRVAITRADNGDRQINYSRLAAALTSSAISNSYYPEGHRGISHTATTALTSLGITAGFNVMREFLPDIRRLTTTRHGKAATGRPLGSERQR